MKRFKTISAILQYYAYLAMRDEQLKANWGSDGVTIWNPVDKTTDRYRRDEENYWLLVD